MCKFSRIVSALRIERKHPTSNIALDWAERAVAATPPDPGAHNYLSIIHLHLGDLPAAETAIRRAIELAPNDAAIQTRLAYLVARRAIR
jgi:Flp pilus assembly protein TadD